MPILVMLREHGTPWHLMDTLTELLDDNDADDRPLATCRELLAQLNQRPAWPRTTAGHEVMIRGTFANIRLRNQLAPAPRAASPAHCPTAR